MGTMLQLLGDPTSEFTKKLGLVFDDPKAMAVLGNPRCKRFSMYVDDGIIKTIKVAEADPKITFVDQILEDIKGASAAAALQYPAAAPLPQAASLPSKTAVQAAFAARENAFSFGSSQGSPLGAYRSLPTQPLQAFRGLQRSLPNLGMARQNIARPRLDEESSAQTSFGAPAALLFGFIVGSAVTFAAFGSRRRASSVEEPFLAIA